MSRLLLSFTAGMLVLALAPRSESAEGSASQPLILVHVMPWFESQEVSGNWGWHWTMNHFDPDQIGPDKRRQIAAHQYPQIGPYDSTDPRILEYQTLLMKIAGVDGAIIDWYGTDKVDDFNAIHERTVALIGALRQRGLKFAICYEDRVIRRVAERDKLTTAAATRRATDHLQFAARHWFGDPLYVRWAGQPLLMVFGPDYLKPPEWAQIIPSLQPTPAFFTLHERHEPAIGSFAWPPMWASRQGTLAPADLNAYLDRFARQPGAKIPCAFPGFHDIYAEAKVRPSYGFLDARDGATFRQTLDRALNFGSPIIQVATWNDYGEGTEVEPTVEAGVRYLAMIQEARRKQAGAAFRFQAADLELPKRIQSFRRSQLSIRPAERPHLESAVRWLDEGQPERARTELDQVHISTLPEPIGSGSSLAPKRKQR